MSEKEQRNTLEELEQYTKPQQDGNYHHKRGVRG